MVNYQMSGYGMGVRPLAEVEIRYTGTELDVASVVSPDPVPLDTYVNILADSVVQFTGYVREVEEIEQGALYKYTIYERADELKRRPYLSGGTLDIFSKGPMQVGALIDDILTATPTTNWARDAGSTDTSSVTLNFYMVNRLQALNKVLREMKGYYVIFISSGRLVKFFGPTGINTDRTASSVVYQTKTLISSSTLRGFTQITVIGKDSSIRGDYGSSTSSRAYYQVDDIETSAEALLIATQIYNDIGVVYEDYKVTVDPSQIQYDVRDKVLVDGTQYWIKEITQGMDEIELILDDGRTSVIESLGNRIHKIDGNFPVGADAQWSGGNANVAANGAIDTEFVFDVKDVTVISEVFLDARISNFDKNTDVGVTTEYLSVPSTVNSSSEYTDTTYFPYESTGTEICEGSIVGITNGFQFAMLTFTADFRSIHTEELEILLQYSYDGSTWYDSWVLWHGVIGHDTAATNNVVPFSFSTIVPGSTGTTLYFKANIWVANGDYLRIWSRAELNAQVVSRHTHAITTIYNKVTPANTPATTLQVKLNSGSYVTLTPGTPIELTGTIGTLITGKNIIYIKTPAGADNMCSVNPTITYQTLKS